jgi:hypothetical protein
VTVALLSLLYTQGEGHKGEGEKSTVLGRWDVPSCVDVRQDALKRSCATWSWERQSGEAVHPRMLGASSE